MEKKIGIILGAVIIAVIGTLIVLRIARNRIPDSPSNPEQRIARAEPSSPRSVPAVQAPKVRRVSPSKALVRPSAPLKHTGSDQIDMIIGLGSETRYGPRMTAAHKLGKHLKKDQLKALTDFMAAPYDPKTTELNLRQINAIKNDALNALISQETIPENLGEQIIEMAADGGMDAMWRDYCVQHFAPYYQKKYPEPMEKDTKDEARDNYIRACWEYVKAPGGPLTGTALLSLERLSETHAEFGKAEIGKVAFAVARDPKSDLTARIPALQIAARMGVGEIAPVARELARGKATTTLKLSAIAALGQIGSDQDIVFLTRIAEGSERHLRKAAAMAIERIKKRAS